MNIFKTLTIGGQTYAVAAGIDDGAVSADTTWSSEKLHTLVGNVEASLDAIIAIQELLIGGEGA